MTENRELICISCPIGCHMNVTLIDNKVKKVEGNSCKRGVAYAKAECTNPTRILTTTIKVRKGVFPLVSVKSSKPLPKHLLLKSMEIINQVQITAPIGIGNIIIKNILGTGVDIVATRNVQKKVENERKNKIAI